MGLFDKRKEQKEFNKQAEWKQGLIPTIVELNEDHLTLTTQTNSDAVFYKDIINVQVVTRIVNIRTNVKTFSLRSSQRRGGNEKANELYTKIMDKMSETK